MQPRPRQNPSAAPVRGGKRQREWTPPPQRGESKGKADRKGAKEEEGKGKSEAKKPIDGKLGEVLVLQENNSGWLDEAYLHALQPLAVHRAELSPNLTAQFAAPLTTKRLRALTDHACPHRSPASETATGVGRPLPEPHHDSDISEDSRQISDPDTEPVVPLGLPLKRTPSSPVTHPKPTEPTSVARAPAKYFLEICAGHIAPL